MHKSLIPLTLMVLGLGACTEPASKASSSAAAQGQTATPADPREEVAAAKAYAAEIRADGARRDALVAKLAADAARKKEGQ